MSLSTLGRRSALRLALLGVAPCLLAACGGAAGAGTTTLAATPAGATPAAASTPSAAPVAATGSGSATAVVVRVPATTGTPGAGAAVTPLPPACRSAPATRCLVTVTAADAGRTLHLLVGTRIRLVLEGSRALGWRSARSSNPLVLRPVPDPLMIAIPIGWVRTDFLVERPGRATITAVQVPACAADHPACLLPDRLFTVTVIARR